MGAERAIEQLLQDWKQAERRAREAELLLYRAYADFTTGKGPAPTEAMKQEATQLRSRARETYNAAMAAVDRVLDEAGRRARQF
jgi:hypothetical protein